MEILPTGHFPLGQFRDDKLLSGIDLEIDGDVLHPEAVQTYQRFILLRDKRRLVILFWPFLEKCCAT